MRELKYSDVFQTINLISEEDLFDYTGTWRRKRAFFLKSDFRLSQFRDDVRAVCPLTAAVIE